MDSLARNNIVQGIGTSPGWDTIPSQGYLEHFISVVGNLYTPGWKERQFKDSILSN